MDILLYGALLLSQIGTAAKQYAMKKCGAVAPGAFNSICINLARALICLGVSLVIWLIADCRGTNGVGWLIAVAAGVGTALNLFTWILSSQRVSLTLIECCCTVGSLVLPLLLAPVLFAGERVTPLQWGGTALVILSLLLFMGKDTKKRERRSLPVSILLLAVCSIGAMVAALSKKLYTFHVSDAGLGSIELFIFISFIAVAVVFSLLFAVYCPKEQRARAAAGTEADAPLLPYRRVWGYILIAGSMLYVSELFATYAAGLPSAVYYPAQKAIGVLGCFLLDVIVFHDRVTAKKILGLCLLILAVVLINL